MVGHLHIAQGLQGQRFTRRPVALGQRKQQVLAHRHVGEQQVVLEQNADPPGLRGKPVYAIAKEAHAACKAHGLVERSADGPQEAGLAAAALAHQRVYLARGNLQLQALQQDAGRAAQRLNMDAQGHGAGAMRIAPNASMCSGMGMSASPTQSPLSHTPSLQR